MDQRNRNYRRVKLFLLAVLCVWAALGCGDDDSTRPPTVFVVHIDSIVGPGEIDEGDTLAFDVHGIIGPSLCYKFKEFDARKTDAQLDLTVLGIVPDLRGLDCATEVSELRGQDGRRGKEFLVAPPMLDPFTIVVHQPDGSTLDKVVRVVSP